MLMVQMVLRLTVEPILAGSGSRPLPSEAEYELSLCGRINELAGSYPAIACIASGQSAS